MLTTWWPSLLVGGGLVAGYLLALRFRPGTLPRWTSWRTIAWVAGAPGVAVALSPPVSELAHHDHRYHMGRHLLVGMYVPLALVLGAPLTLLLGSLPRRTQLRLTRMLRSRPVHVVSHPVTAPLLTVVGMFALYLTPLYAVSMARPEVHVLVMAHFVLAGYLYAWAIAGPDPAPRRPRDGHPNHGADPDRRCPRVPGQVPLRQCHGPGGWSRSRLHVPSRHPVDVYGGDIAEIALAALLFAWWYRRRTLLGT